MVDARVRDSTVLRTGRSHFFVTAPNDVCAGRVVACSYLRFKRFVEIRIVLKVGFGGEHAILAFSETRSFALNRKQIALLVSWYLGIFRGLPTWLANSV